MESFAAMYGEKKMFAVGLCAIDCGAHVVLVVVVVSIASKMSPSIDG
jgi:hypothetical protein